MATLSYLLLVSRVLLVTYTVKFWQSNFSLVHLNWLIGFDLIERVLKLGGICILPELRILLMLSHHLSIIDLLLLLIHLLLIHAHLLAHILLIHLRPIVAILLP